MVITTITAFAAAVRCLVRQPIWDDLACRHLHYHHHHYHHHILRATRMARLSLSWSLTQHSARRGILSQALEDRLTTMKTRQEEILKEMSSAGPTQPGLSKELAALSLPMNLMEMRDSLLDDQEQLQYLLRDSAGDKLMEQECKLEIERLQQTMTKLEQDLVDALLPQEQEDFESDAIIEIRAGTGGDEASLFASELFEAYQRLAKHYGFRAEPLDYSSSDIGGLKEGSMLVSGGAVFTLPSLREKDPTEDDNDSHDNDGDDDTNDENAHDTNEGHSATLLGPYGTFKFESGVHRVQRVPVNDSRIHTSACSVAVMPSLKDNSANMQQALPVADLKIETMRASGAGGQHVNTTESAVRITHIPTGITAAIQDERSQHKNREKALKLITARVRDAERAREAQARGEAKSALMGGGDRSERIRTYNFSQDRITDHRCKVTRHGIEALLSGNKGAVRDSLVATFLPHLVLLRRRELLDQIETGQR